MIDGLGERTEFMQNLYLKTIITMNEPIGTKIREKIAFFADQSQSFEDLWKGTRPLVAEE